MQRWWTWVLTGLLLLAGGVLALFNPFAASLAVAFLAAWVFLTAGALQLVWAFTGGDRWLNLVFGLLAFGVGVALLANPLAGLVSLTALLGVIFLISGILRLIIAYGLRETSLFWLMLLSGAFSVLLGIIVFGDIQQAASNLLGLLLALELISAGIGQITFGTMLRQSRR
ncbi:DUF308 domain-containing protein [Pseudooceanicola sp.]|uniref:HdeD family acid-resistance protein n=1 Tax=Pseudooceanicola sp. TaxID=1914328 RepID=UPI0026183952|nr:DUF308 domain-containing protein [Pseudooceanicola sp.]MDF1857204.1 DUF308 domain-containing protein [Pseudooceanicola sp.]